MTRFSGQAVHQEMESLTSPHFWEVAEAVLRQGALLRFRASGSSMYPLVRDGDIATVTRSQANKPIRLGDIVLFRNPATGRPILHRIIRIKNGGFLTAGDNACQTDEAIDIPDVLGVLTRLERAGRRIRLGLGPDRLLFLFLIRIKAYRPLVKAAAGFYRQVFLQKNPS